MEHKRNNVFVKTPLNNVVKIEKLVTVHYFEFANNYVFQGESHDFWEFLYVDKGEVEILADDIGYKLTQGDIVFHKPNEFHSVWANGVTAPNIVVISFCASGSHISFFENKILKINNHEKNLIAKVLTESREAFSNNFSIDMTRLEKKANSIVGCEQMIKLYLEELLINLIRDNDLEDNGDRISYIIKERMENDIIHNITSYMEKNICENLSFDNICSKFSISKTHLKTMFKNNMGAGVMTYFRSLKIEEAKKLIRTGKYNFTEIADILGYDSVHYFSRIFKKCTNMTPSEYSLSVKARAEL